MSMSPDDHDDDLGDDESDDLIQGVLDAFGEQLARETPLSGLAALAAEFWRSLVAADMPGYHASILVAQWLTSNGAAGAQVDE